MTGPIITRKHYPPSRNKNPFPNRNRWRFFDFITEQARPRSVAVAATLSLHMTSRGQAPGMMRHVPFPGLGPHRPFELPPPQLMENKIASQVVEMERLAGDNQRLAATHVALRRDIIATRQEIQRLQAHLGSIHTESDIQIRLLLDKINKMELDIRAAQTMKMDLHEAHKETQSLVTTRQELLSEVQQATEELQKVEAEVEQLPELQAELENLRQEHQRLLAVFEYEKGLNAEHVEKLQSREKNLISMAKEVEKLRAEISNTEKKTHAPYPYGVTYTNPDSSYPPPPPPPLQGGGIYMDGYGGPHIQMGGGVAGNGVNTYGIVPGASNNGAGSIGASVGTGVNGAVVSSDGGGAWR